MSDIAMAGHQDLEAYLVRLDAALRALPAEEREEIVLETRSHILDSLRLAGDRAVVFTELGPPELYARSFLDALDEPESNVVRTPRAPTLLLRLAAGGAGAFIALNLMVAAYGLALVLLLLAGLKLLHPERVGVWIDPTTRSYSVALTGSSGAPAGSEVLGWWLVPITLTLAALLYVATTRLTRAVILWREATRGRALAIPLALALLSGCATLPEAGRLDADESAVELPSRFHDTYLQVQVEVAGRDTTWLLLDSGSQVIVIDSRLAEASGAASAGTSSLTGFGGEAVAGQLLRDVRVRPHGGSSFEEWVPVADLSPLEPYLGFAIPGILGAALFQRFVVEIDYEAGRVTLHDPRRFRPPPSAVRLPLVVERGLPYVEASIELAGGDVVRGRFIIDTGYGGTMSLVSPFVAAHDLMPRVPRTIPQPVVGLGGQGHTPLGRVQAVRLGQFVLAEPTVLLSRDTVGLGAQADRAGSIGGGLLSRFTVTFDYRAGLLYLQPNSSFSDPFIEELSGTTIIARGDDLATIVVEAVQSGSPAHEAGLMPGDTLVEIDGRDVDELGLWRVRKLLRTEPGRTVQLLVERGGVERIIGVRLERRL